jgi:hypothetical protein
MTEHKNIYAALCAAQSEFGKVTKGATNPAFKSKYADLADVAGVIIPTMNAHGCAVLHYVVDGAMRTEFVHAASETKVTCDVPLIVDRQNMQGMKSATTYAKRIGLESLSGIAPEDDDGNAAAKAPPKNEPAPSLITEDQRGELMTLFTHLNVPVAEFLAVAKVASLDKLPAAWFDRAKTWVNDKAKQKREAAKPSVSDELDDNVQY